MKLKVTNPKVVFDFNLNRRVTVVQGDSGSGKTWLAELVRVLDDVTYISCERPVTFAPMIPKGKISQILPAYNNYVLVIDEDMSYAMTTECVNAVLENDIWVIISSRASKVYPYSADEVYRIKTSGKIKTLTKDVGDRVSSIKCGDSSVMQYLRFKVDEDELVRNPSATFNSLYEDSWFDDELTMRMIEDIDGVKHIVDDIFKHETFGTITAKELSGGVKTFVVRVQESTPRQGISVELAR